MQVHGSAPSAAAPSGNTQAVPPVAADAPPKPNPAELALVIEPDAAAGQFIYKTVDRRTGDVIRQLPDPQVLRLRESADYDPGAVVSRSV